MAENIINIPSGDMEKSVYDADNNGIVDNSEQLNGQDPDYYLSYGTNQGTTASILALNPTLYLNEIWWSTDERRRYTAVSSVTEGIDVWQPVDLEYDKDTDTYKLTPTQDGQVQNIGQEQFMACHTLEAAIITALEPKVLLVTGIHTGVGTIKEVALPVAADLTDGSTFGVNTTAKNSSGYLKITVFGDINDVKTDQWAVKAILYLDPITPGLLTDVKPLTKAFAVAQVTVSHATEGKLFVNTVRAVTDEALLVPAGLDRLYFTGDQTDAGDPAGLDNFYLVKRDDKGTVATATEIAICPDNTKVGVSKYHLGPVSPTDITFPAGTYKIDIEFQIDSTGGEERVHIEIYLANGDGTVVDAGTGLPVGSLGVPPIVISSSGLLDGPSGIPTFVTLVTSLAASISVTAGQRVLYYILGEKVGTIGGDKTFTFYYGSDHLTFAEVPKLIYFNDLADVIIQAPITGEVPMVGVDDIWRNTNPASLITGRMRWMGIWVGGSYVEDDVTRDGDWTMIANTATSQRPAPQPTGPVEYSLPDDIIWPVAGSANAVIHSGHTYTFTSGGWLTEFRMWVPVLSGTTSYRFKVYNVTDPNNIISQDYGEPILNEDDWTVVVGLNTIVNVGTKLLVILDSYDSANETVAITDGWNYQGDGNDLTPASTQWNTRNNASRIRIHEQSLGGNYESQIAGFIAGTVWRFEQVSDSNRWIEYEQDNVALQIGVTPNSYFEFNFTQQGLGSSGAPLTGEACTVTATTSTPNPTFYEESPIYWSVNGEPSWATVQGYLTIGGVDQVVPDSAFGVDLRFQPGALPTDWDVVAHSGGVSGGGAGGVTVHEELTGRDTIDQHPISAITDLQTELDGKEASLGNPLVDGYILSSTILGVRSWIEMSGGGASGFSVNQVAHGFAVGDPVTEAGGVWSRADTSLEANTAEGLVIEVVDVDNFIASTLGEIEWLSHGHALNAWLYLDASGNYTTTAPSVEGDIVQFCFKTMDAARVYVNVSQPEVVAVAGGGGTGDMSKAVYDIDDNGIVDNSEALNGRPDTDFESALGNPLVDGQVLSSLINGTRSWIAANVSSAIDFVTDNSLVRVDGTGKVVQQSLVVVDDTGIMSNALIDAGNNTITNIDRAEFGVDIVSEFGNLDGLSFDKVDMVIVNDGGLQLDIEKIGGGDVRYLINGVVTTLNCTTGAGVGGKARIALVEGADVNNPVNNWIYITDSGSGVGALNITTGTNLPTGAFGWIGKIKVADAVTWATSGAFAFQRYTETFSNDSRGTQSHTREKLRALGALYIEGVAQTLNITVNAGAADNVHLATTAGQVYQLHRQTFPAFSTGPYYYGNGLNIYEQFPDLNNILTTEDGSVIGNNDRFNVIVWGAVNITSGECKLFANKPTDVYGSDSQAIADINNTADYTIPEGMRTVAFMIARLVFKYSAGDSGTWTELGEFSILGTPVGVRVGGAVSSANNDFSDAQFNIFDDLDSSKQIAFQASGIATATTRTISMPDADVDLGNLIDNDTGGTTSVVNSVWLGTEAEYVALGVYDPAILYFRTA